MFEPKRSVLKALLLLATLAVAAGAEAQLRVEITQGVVDPIPIAVVPLAASADPGLDIAGVVQHDLESSGRFRALARSLMRSQPGRASEVQAADWRALGSNYVLVGRVSPAEGGYGIACDLINTNTGQLMGSWQVSASPATLRNGAHRISDFVYEKLLGARGAFATRIAYVAVSGEPPHQHFELKVADADGENPKVVLTSDQPIMSPAWSPDGEWLAYVSFENHISSVYVQRVRTAERHMVSARAGVNGAPAWSPDGKHLALALSGSNGNLDIYDLDLSSQGLVRLTDNPAIDTEPVWSVDGRQIYFTSDRSGGPEIYRLDVANPQHVQRMTFGSSYNARARLSPDGKQLAYVTREGSDYRIAIQDVAGGSMRVLSSGRLDESPSFSPNGMTLIYSSRQGAMGVLATVSADGLVTQRLNSTTEGEVREPVWGPFAP
jgi:TolB protein